MYLYVMLVAAVLTVIYVVFKIRQHKLETSDALFWFFFSLLLAVFALVPSLSDFLSNAFGFQSPVNLILVVVIALLLYHQLAQSVNLVKMRGQLSDIAEKLALMQGTHFSQEGSERNDRS